ncbi:protein E14 [Elephant endotheliotropic herpesvirus 6]|nr:protein E14 [Elephant endotheliotropic herpesvirus 6]
MTPSVIQSKASDFYLVTGPDEVTFEPYISDMVIFMFVINIVLCFITCIACYRKGYAFATMSNSILCIMCTFTGTYIHLSFRTTVETHWNLSAFSTTLLLIMSALVMLLITMVSVYKYRNGPTYYGLYIINRGMIFMLIFLWWADIAAINNLGVKDIKYSSSVCIDIANWLLTFIILCIIIDVFGGIEHLSGKYDIIIYICILWYMWKEPMTNINPSEPHIYALIAFSYMFSKKIMEYELLYVMMD